MSKKHYLLALALVAAGAGLYVKQPKFGSLPTGTHLEAIEKSPHYADGKFRNIIHTPQFAENSSLLEATLGFLSKDRTGLSPTGPIPAVKTDLAALDKNEDIVIWLGHSSYFVQLNGRRILIDPVLSPSAAPLDFMNKAFPGSNIYTPADMPDIDYLLLTHDHWDHLDYPTVTALQGKIKRIVCPLGVGGYFRQWGFDSAIIDELDWFGSLPVDGLTIHALPARHFSGRLILRDRTLWCGFALLTPQRKLFFSGDSGYGPHFADIGQKFGGFDFATLDSGQYDKNWPYIHMNPEQAAQAAEDLNTKLFLPAHIGKFSIANHPWDEPFERASAAGLDKHHIATPLIGQPVYLDGRQQTFTQWWKDVQ